MNIMWLVTSIFVHRKCFNISIHLSTKWNVWLSLTISQTDAIELRMLLLQRQLRRRRWQQRRQWQQWHHVIYSQKKNEGQMCARTKHRPKWIGHWYNLRVTRVSTSLCLRAIMLSFGNWMNGRRRHLRFRYGTLLLAMELILVLNSNLARKSKIKLQRLCNVRRSFSFLLRECLKDQMAMKVMMMSVYTFIVTYQP